MIWKYNISLLIGYEEETNMDFQNFERRILINMKTIGKVILGVVILILLILLAQIDPSVEMNKKLIKPNSIGIMY
tara:strand:+ start:268 stop:492 length:225 start_codon:yes stop_codon:yes gene_type:complete